MTRDEWIARWLDELIGMTVQFYEGGDLAGRGLYIRQRMNLAKAFLAKQYDLMKPPEVNNGSPPRTGQKAPPPARQ